MKNISKITLFNVSLTNLIAVEKYAVQEYHDKSTYAYKGILKTVQTESQMLESPLPYQNYHEKDHVPPTYLNQRPYTRYNDDIEPQLVYEAKPEQQLPQITKKITKKLKTPTQQFSQVSIKKNLPKRNSLINIETKGQEAIQQFQIMANYEEKLKETQQQMKVKQMLIDQVLDRYNVNKQTHAQATKTLQDLNISKWVQRVGNQKTGQNQDGADPNYMDFSEANEQDKQLKEFVKSLFQQWDEPGFGKLKIIYLVKNFIALGLAANEEIAISFFRNLVVSNDGQSMTKLQVLQSEINVDTFLSLFSSNDVFSKRMLKVLDQSVRDKHELNDKNHKDQSQIVTYKSKQTKMQNYDIIGQGNKQQALTLQDFKNSQNNEKSNNLIKSMIRNQIYQLIRIYCPIYRKIMSQTTKSQFEAKQNQFQNHKELETLMKELKDTFGPHAGQFAEVFDQILHINRQIVSQRPTSIQMIKEALGDKAIQVNSNLKLLQLYRHSKTTINHQIYKHFNSKTKALQEYRNLQSCIGPYFQDFSINPQEIDGLTKNEEVIYLQTLLKNLVKSQFKYKQENKVVKKNVHEKIYEQMEVLNEWWAEMDPDNKNVITLTQFRELLKSKHIITGDSDLKRLLKKTIPKEIITQDCLKQSQYMKIFAKAMLKGAIVNIFVYIRQLIKHEIGEDTHDGQLLKVLKFQRDLVIGGLTAQHDVSGIDAVSMVLQLQDQRKKYPEDFEKNFSEPINYESIMKYLKKNDN